MQITAKIIKDSINPNGVRITTVELEYPRFIHSEVMTHRMFSRNAASSRAIPFAAMQEQLTARPVRFGEANAGMQDKGEDFESAVRVNTYGEPLEYDCPEYAWGAAREEAISFQKAFPRIHSLPLAVGGNAFSTIPSH